jgi:membrane-associated progesterone receptor component
MVLQRIADAVQAYTGLSLAAAATILALMLATYLLVSSLFVAPVSSSSAPPEPPHQDKNEEEKDKEQEEEATVSFVFPDPVEVGEVTLEQLRAYDGKDPAKQILIAIRSQVYDVSRGR